MFGNLMNRSMFRMLAVLALACIVSLVSAQAPPGSRAATVVEGKYALRVQPPIVLPASRKVYQTADTGTLWSGSVFYDVRNSHADGVIMNDVFTLTQTNKVTGVVKSTGFVASLFVGATVNKANQGVAGVALGHKWQFFDQVSAYLGFGLSISSGVPMGAGPLAGLTIGIGPKPASSTQVITLSRMLDAKTVAAIHF